MVEITTLLSAEIKDYRSLLTVKIVLKASPSSGKFQIFPPPVSQDCFCQREIILYALVYRKASGWQQTSRICFSCTGGKNHQCPILSTAETLFKFRYRLILATTQSFLFQCRESDKCIFNPQLLNQFMWCRDSHYRLEIIIFFTKITEI